MPLPVTIPNTFANATSSIPLSQLDANFSTLANAVNDINSGATTLVNLKASNVTITGGTISNVTLDNVTVQTESFDNVTLSNVTITSGNATFTNVTVTNATVNSAAAVNISDAQTLTNKRINPRVVAAAATTGNLTINGDTTDLYKAEGLTGAITFLQPSGTPVDGQKLIIRIEDDGTARGITWTTTSGAFRAVGITLPTTTVLSKVTYVGCIYNSTDSFWDAVATVTQS